jgi:hypothetical protein
MMTVKIILHYVDTNAETLKRQRPIGEGDQELEIRLVQELT